MDDSSKVMDLAYEAGSILLENGAEISRVEETMQRIAGHFGVEDESVFVLSNGIMATSKGYARSKFIPIKGTSLDKVVAVNQLSREVAQGQCNLPELERRLQESQMESIRKGMPPLPVQLTPENDAQLVAEGFLPPVDEEGSELFEEDGGYMVEDEYYGDEYEDY